MFARLIDHAALFPPASMELDEALAADREARSSEHAELMNRFVAPAARVSELPEERPGLSVVLGDAAEAAPPGDERVEAWSSRWRARGPARPTCWTRIGRSAAGREVYFELLFDDGWRDAVPAAIGAVAAVGGRVKLRCGGGACPRWSSSRRDRLLPRGRRPLQGHGRAAPRGAPRRGARLPQPDGGGDRAARADRRRGRGGGLGGARRAAESRDLFDGFGSCSWSEPIDDLRELGLLS